MECGLEKVREGFLETGKSNLLPREEVKLRMGKVCLNQRQEHQPKAQSQEREFSESCYNLLFSSLDLESLREKTG
jgi:hypothetical protein